MRRCVLCGKQNKRGEHLRAGKIQKRSCIERHHIRYTPEIVIDLCRSCHVVVSNFERNPDVYNLEDSRFRELRAYVQIKSELLAKDIETGGTSGTVVISFRLRCVVMEWLAVKAKGKPVTEYIRDMIMKSYDTVNNSKVVMSSKATTVNNTETAIPWYNPEIHTTGDVVRMRDPRTKEVKVVTL